MQLVYTSANESLFFTKKLQTRTGISIIEILMEVLRTNGSCKVPLALQSLGGTCMLCSPTSVYEGSYILKQALMCVLWHLLGTGRGKQFP